MSFVSLNTALSGIRAGRAGLDTAAHNVANANTPGFTRQRVDLATSYPYLSPNGPMGTGVTVADIARTRDTFLDARLRGDTGRSGELDVRADLLARAETVFGEPENGLTGELTELWAAFEDLALSPEDRATRRQVLSSLESVAARVNSIDGGLRILEADTATSLEQAVKKANGLFDRVADLNRSILDATSGRGSPNDLMDQRDDVIDQLSRLVGVQTTLEANGSLRVSVSGMAVVSGTRSQHLHVEDDRSVVHTDTGAPVRPGGEIGGMQRFLTEDFGVLTGELEAFVAELVGGLDTQHRQGYTAEDPPQTDTPLVAYTSDARSLQMTVLVTDPDQLAAAEEPGKPHDGRNATALADLRTTSGIDTALRALVTEHAANVAASQRAAKGQQQLTAAAANAREGMHGVSLDEEMVSMLNYQRALEASSRMMSAVDQALDTIINRTGLVGR